MLPLFSCSVGSDGGWLSRLNLSLWWQAMSSGEISGQTRRWCAALDGQTCMGHAPLPCPSRHTNPRKQVQQLQAISCTSIQTPSTGQTHAQIKLEVWLALSP